MTINHRVCLWARVLSLGVAASLSGCGVHFYSAERDETAQKAKEAFANSGLDQIAATEQRNNDRLLEAELEATYANARLERDQKLNNLISDFTLGEGLYDLPPGAVSPTWCSGERGPVGEALCRLGISRANLLEPLDNAYAFLVGSSNTPGRLRIERNRTRLQPLLGAATPNCQDIYGAGFIDSSGDLIDFNGDPLAPRRDYPSDEFVSTFAPSVKKEGDRQRAADLLEKLYSNCSDFVTEELISIRSLLNGARPRGTLHRALDAFDRAAGTSVSAKAKLAATRSELKKKATELGGEEAPSPEKYSETLQTQAKQIAELLKGASNVGELLGGAEVQLESLEQILGAVASGEIPKEDSGTDPQLLPAITVAASLPTLAGDMQALVVANQRPPPAALATEIGRLRVEVSYLEKKLLLELARRDVAFGALVAGLQQASLLRRIALDRLELCKPQECSPADLKKYVKEASPNSFVNTSLVAFANAVGIAGANIEAAKDRARHLQHLDVIIERDRVIGFWRVLIAGSLDDLASYHASGVKPETVAAFAGRLANLGLLGGVIATN